MSGDTLGDRMKAYEQVTRSVLLPHSLTILRVDGRAFHSYLRNAEKPYDFTFMHDMQVVGAALCADISGAVFAYGQSDEISVLLSDVEPQSQPWFGGVIQKVASVGASIATMTLNYQRGTVGRPHFDGRVFTVPSSAEAANYFIWRQRDAVRNSISMAAQAKFSPNQLHGVSTGQMQEMLFAEHSINWNDYADTAKRGWVVTRETREAEVRFKNRRTQAEEVTTAVRTFWVRDAAPHFTFDGDFFAEQIPGLKVGPPEGQS